MPNEINNPANPTHFVAHNEDGSVSHVGVTGPGQVTTTGQPLFEFSDDPEKFLEQTGDVAMGDLPELPREGELVRVGVYAYEGRRVVARQEHTRTEHDVEDVPALFAFQQIAEGDEILPWIAAESVSVGWHREYEGTVYAVLQAHTTQSDWTPPETPALWEPVAEDDSGGESGYPAWEPWDGTNESLYHTGDRVSHKDRNWESQIDDNHWEPGEVGENIWKDLGAV